MIACRHTAQGMDSVLVSTRPVHLRQDCQDGLEKTARTRQARPEYCWCYVLRTPGDILEGSLSLVLWAIAECNLAEV